MWVVLWLTSGRHIRYTVLQGAVKFRLSETRRIQRGFSNVSATLSIAIFTVNDFGRSIVLVLGSDSEIDPREWANTGGAS
jgi:hypothetical protein